MANVTGRYRSHESWRLDGWLERGEIIGVCGIEVHADYVEILHIAVAENKRRQGVGGKMVATLQTAYHLPIEAETDDDAVDFYHKCGFETTAIRKYDVRRWTCVLAVKTQTLGYIMNLRRYVGHSPLIMCASPVIVENAAGEILLQRRRDNGMWGCSGGALELGESFEDCAKRELFEETGLTAHSLELLKVFSGLPPHTYPNGDIVETVLALYVCRNFTGELKPQTSEVSDLQWFGVNRLPENIHLPDRLLLRTYWKKRV
jgi:8-oxo-dGTP pyrophosphatase MutT (NUDIX family)